MVRVVEVILFFAATFLLLLLYSAGGHSEGELNSALFESPRDGIVKTDPVSPEPGSILTAGQEIEFVVSVKYSINPKYHSKFWSPVPTIRLGIFDTSSKSMLKFGRPVELTIGAPVHLKGLEGIASVRAHAVIPQVETIELIPMMPGGGLFWKWLPPTIDYKVKSAAQ